MAQQRFKSADSPPTLLVAIGSLAILAHLGAVIVHVLAAPSGPWPNPEGMNMAGPPAFTQPLDESLVQRYLKPIKLTHNYHFLGNRPMAPGVYVEIRLKDKKGELIKTLRFPDAEANPWVRHMQGLFAQGLVPDQPIAAPQGEAIPAPHQQVKLVPIWDLEANDSLRLRRVPEHLIPRNRPVWGPTEWSLVLVNSYARYLCRTYGAVSAELIRHSRDTVTPTVLLLDNRANLEFKDLVANYGELSGE